jgi:hypothetical protein
MRKKIISRERQTVVPHDQDWLDLENLTQVELTSEDSAHPIESALTPDGGPGWRAAAPGRQTIRLLFDRPQKIRHIRLVIGAGGEERTQEFLLRSSADGGRSYQAIARQQYNFSTPDATRELEEYQVELDGVTLLELDIIPDISGGNAHASLAELRLA